MIRSRNATIKLVIVWLVLNPLVDAGCLRHPVRDETFMIREARDT